MTPRAPPRAPHMLDTMLTPGVPVALLPEGSPDGALPATPGARATRPPEAASARDPVTAAGALDIVDARVRRAVERLGRVARTRAARQQRQLAVAGGRLVRELFAAELMVVAALAFGVGLLLGRRHDGGRHD